MLLKGLTKYDGLGLCSGRQRVESQIVRYLEQFEDKEKVNRPRLGEEVKDIMKADVNFWTRAQPQTDCGVDQNRPVYANKNLASRAGNILRLGFAFRSIGGR